VDHRRIARSGTFSLKRERSASATSRVVGLIILSSKASGEMGDAINYSLFYKGISLFIIGQEIEIQIMDILNFW